MIFSNLLVIQTSSLGSHLGNSCYLHMCLEDVVYVVGVARIYSVCVCPIKKILRESSQKQESCQVHVSKIFASAKKLVLYLK